MTTTGNHVHDRTRLITMQRLPLIGIVLLAGACGADDGGSDLAATTETTTTVPAVLYEGSGMVLESPDHGPELCLGGAEDSLPPQCEGTELVGWDWGTVDDEESTRGTTWGQYRVVGTWDGSRLTVAEPPGPPQFAELPDLEVAERDPATVAALETALAEVAPRSRARTARWVSC